MFNACGQPYNLEEDTDRIVGKEESRQEKKACIFTIGTSVGVAGGRLATTLGKEAFNI